MKSSKICHFMKARLLFALLGMLASAGSSALELAPEDFLAARSMTCVLAQESLGYLSEEEYAEMAEAVLADYDQAEGDIIYAQALGYFDGLMFGLVESDDGEINARLQDYISSAACRAFTGFSGASFSL